MDARVRLEAARPKLKEEQRHKTDALFKQLQRLENKIYNFASNDKPSEALVYYEEAVMIDTGLKNLLEDAEMFVIHESELYMEKTDFSGIDIAK